MSFLRRSMTATNCSFSILSVSMTLPRALIFPVSWVPVGLILDLTVVVLGGLVAGRVNSFPYVPLIANADYAESSLDQPPAQPKLEEPGLCVVQTLSTVGVWGLGFGVWGLGFG